MKIIKINNNDKDISFLLNVEKDQWKKMQEKAFKKIAKNLKIPGGFRPGTDAHNKKAKSMVNEGEILERAINNEIGNINKFLIQEKQFLDLEDDLLNEQPNVNIEKVDNDLLSILFIYKKIPTTKIGDYKKIKIELDNKVSESEIKKEIEKYLNNNSELLPKKDGVIGKGDFVIFDFEGYIDNKKMENGSSKNFEIEIGSNQFIPGFEDQMIGMKLNEEGIVKVIFPKDYHAKEVANKEAIFNVKINDIKVKSSPKLDDKFVQSLKLKDINTKEEFNKFIKDKLIEEKTKKSENDLKNKFFEELAKITELSHNDDFSVAQEKKAIENEYNRMLAQSGIDLESYLKITGQDKKVFYNNIEKQAIQNVKIKYAIIEISEIEKIDASENELKLYLEEIAKEQKIKLDELKEKLGSNIEILKEKLIFNKTIDFLIKHALKKEK